MLQTIMAFEIKTKEVTSFVKPLVLYCFISLLNICDSRCALRSLVHRISILALAFFAGLF